jgi:hypothetical protein
MLQVVVPLEKDDGHDEEYPSPFLSTSSVREDSDSDEDVVLIGFSPDEKVVREEATPMKLNAA